jgi:hypothetical protein
VAQLDQVAASHAVLIEVANVLGAFRDHLVIIGGWVPELLLPNHGHIGSVDVDLAVAPTALAGNAYQTICRRLLNAGYAHQMDPTRFIKNIPGAPEPVKVDLISGEYVQGEKATSIQVNELRLSSLRGIDLAFGACDPIEISGAMPDGARNVVRARIVRPEAFILIKAFALADRTKEKDAYDIAFVLQYYEPDLADLAARVRVHAAAGLGREAYGILKEKFALIDSVGPVWAANVLAEQGGGGDNEPGTGTGGFDYEQAQRAAFENAQELFSLVDERG